MALIPIDVAHQIQISCSKGPSIDRWLLNSCGFQVVFKRCVDSTVEWIAIVFEKFLAFKQGEPLFTRKHPEAFEQHLGPSRVRSHPQILRL